MKVNGNLYSIKRKEIEMEAVLFKNYLIAKNVETKGNSQCMTNLKEDLISREDKTDSLLEDLICLSLAQDRIIIKVFDLESGNPEHDFTISFPKFNSSTLLPTSTEIFEELVEGNFWIKINPESKKHEDLNKIQSEIKETIKFASICKMKYEEDGNRRVDSYYWARNSLTLTGFISNYWARNSLTLTGFISSWIYLTFPFVILMVDGKEVEKHEQFNFIK